MLQTDHSFPPFIFLYNILSLSLYLIPASSKCFEKTCMHNANIRMMSVFVCVFFLIYFILFEQNKQNNIRVVFVLEVFDHCFIR